MCPLPGLLLLALAAPLTAGTWHVDASAPCPGSGSLAAPFCTIQAALDAAAPGDEILVEPGVYNELIDFLGKDVELKSTAGAATTIIDGRGQGSVVTFDGGESRAALISGFTLRHGDGIFTAVGAGIHCAGSSPTIADNVIEDSFGSKSGGGIALLGGSPLVIGNVVQNNSADFGAGIHCAQGTTAQIIDNQVLGNGQFGTTGGGIHVHDSGVLIEGNLIQGNSSACCSGVYVDSTVPVVVRGNTIRANFADEGDAGGVFSTPGTLVEDNLIEDNAASGDGSGVFAHGGTYRNNRITGNTSSVGFVVVIQNGASFEGDVIAGNDSVTGVVNANATPSPAPIHLSRVTISGHGKFAYSLINFLGTVIAEDCLIADNYGGVVVSTTGHVVLRRCTLTGQEASAVATELLGHATLESCIVWDNSPVGIEFDPSGGPIDATWSIVKGGWPGTGNQNADPLFVDAPGGDYTLSAGSPAIDAGHFLMPIEDIFSISGTPRRLDGHLDVGAEVDCGALEFDNVLLATSSPSAGVLKIDLTGTAGLQTFILAAAQPGTLFVEKWGLFGLDLGGPFITAPWPGAPSSVSVNVAPAFSGLPVVLQALAGPPGGLAQTGNLSNVEAIELP